MTPRALRLRRYLQTQDTRLLLALYARAARSARTRWECGVVASILRDRGISLQTGGHSS